MGLVEYSDSESEGDTASVPAPKKTAAFQKAAPGKLQVNLPTLQPEPSHNGNTDTIDGPPTKRVRTGGAFSGFNALLPAPKKPATTAAAALKKGVHLKTSSEAAFSRNPLPQQTDDHDTYTAPDLNNVGESQSDKKDEPPPEPKMVGKATRFLPLSVSTKKKKKPLPKIPASDSATKSTASAMDVTAPDSTKAEPPRSKAKKSLFYAGQEIEVPEAPSATDYEPITLERPQASQQIAQPTQPSQPCASANPNSLEAVAAGMNLTPAQRRQLFGRKGGDVNVQHFDLDAQYAENERARLAGEVVEHRAVKAVAPGKHSLQQLVNNAQTQQEALQDKWADGKRARGEGGSKYGWST